MKSTILLAGFTTMISVSVALAATAATPPTTTAAATKAPIPCGELSKQVAEAMKEQRLSPAKLKIAIQHEKAGNALCTVKKDAAADTQFEIVLDLLK